MEKKKKTYQAKLEVENNGKIFQKEEVVDGYQILKLPTKSYFNNGEFVTLFQEALKEIVTKGSLTKNEMQLLMYLVATTGKGNSVCLDLNVLSSDLKVKKPNISTALAGLVERNIIIRKDGYRYSKQPLPMQLSVNYDQFNYDLGYTGKVSQYKKLKAEHPQIIHKDTDKELDKYKQTSILDELKGREFDD